MSDRNETDAAAISDPAAYNDANGSGDASEKALAVNIRKYRKQGIIFASCGLAGVVIATLLLERSGFSNLWIAVPLATAVLLQFEYAATVEQSFIGETQRQANQQKSPSGSGRNEEVDAINAVIGKLMPIVNTDLLLPVLDLLEDAMKSTFPAIFSSVLDAVRIDEMDLGVTPFRLNHIKRLADDERIAENHDPGTDNAHFVNMEICFAYDGLDRKAASENVHMIVYIAAGIKKWSTFELPVFAELQSASGTMRVRAELISDPPFIRNTTISFPDMPNFTLAARPLKTVNVMRLPLLSEYVHKAVAQVLSSFIAPNAFTIDAARLMMGRDVDLNTEAQGAVALIIHSASGLSNTDHGSKSDPFVIVTWSKLGKTLYTTRVIRDELDPRWEEATFIPVPPDAFREGERITLSVWDSDKFTADDSLGKAEISINDLFDKQGELFVYEKSIEGAYRDANNNGVIKFSAGYFASHDLSKGSRKAPPGTTIKLKVGGTGAPLVDHTREDPGSKARSGHFAEFIKERMDAKLPPSPKQVSGILALQVHQLADLDIPSKNRAVSNKSRQDSSNTPSTYAQVFVNDELVFKTRLKRLNTSPYINARTEVFCRDWTRTRVDVVVLDAREREDDAVLGIVSMRLADILSSSSQVTAWRPLLGGIGNGRARLSVLLKPLDLFIPVSLRGWNIGTVLIDKIVAEGVPQDYRGLITIRLAGARYKVHTDVMESNGNSTVTWQCEPPIRVPVVSRYKRALSLRLQDTNHTFGRNKSMGEGVLWLCNVTDDTEATIPVALYHGDDVKRRRANNEVGLAALPTSESNRDDPEYKDGAGEAEMEGDVAPLSDHLDMQHPFLRVSLRFTRGLSSIHRELVGDTADPSLYHSLKMREHAIEAGERRHGSAAFMHQDQKQKAARERQVRQAREAQLDKADLQNAENDRAYVDGPEIYLGTLQQEEGGGIGEGASDLLHKMNMQGQAGDDRDWDDTDSDLDGDAAERAERDAEDKLSERRRRNRDDLKADRLHERGVFQAKIARTAKWLKDGSARRAQKLQRRLRHTDAIPIVEEEGVSRL